MQSPPLILTLALNAEAEDFFNALRQQHFPRERNFLAAHLTLFHHLPHGLQIFDELTALRAKQKRFALNVTGIASIGRGVAFKIESDLLQALHKRLQQQWQPWLIPQDRQRLWPHVTVQNKVAPETAQALLQELQQKFSPFEIRALGVKLWNYLGGPWELKETFLFESGD